MTSPLDDEARILSRYLIGRETDSRAAARYAAGCSRIFASQEDPAEAAVVGFALRHPRTLPLLDAASGLLAPQSLLRRKLLLMLAVLEAAPEQASLFQARRRARAAVVMAVAGRGLWAVLKAVAGAMLLPIARRAA